MSLLTATAALERNDDLHLARLLVLLGAFAGRDGSGAIDGLTKLAKLDFLLRYPVYLERALTARGQQPSAAEVKEHERRSVESAMVRFRYGPWDFRYRRLANLLVARGLLEIRPAGQKVILQLTPKGLEIAAQLAKTMEFRDVARRSTELRRHFDLSGTWLKNFVYATFPEIASLKLGEEISL